MIGLAALGSSYLPHGKGLREHIEERTSNMDLSVWSEFPETLQELNPFKCLSSSLEQLENDLYKAMSS